MPSKLITMRMDEELINVIDKAAALIGSTRSELTRQLYIEYIQRIKKQLKDGPEEAIIIPFENKMEPSKLSHQPEAVQEKQYTALRIEGQNVIPLMRPSPNIIDFDDD